MSRKRSVGIVACATMILMHMQAITLTGLEWNQSQESHSSSFRLYHLVAFLGLVFLAPSVLGLFRGINRMQFATLGMLTYFFVYSVAISGFELSAASALPLIAIVFALLGMIFATNLGVEKTVHLFTICVGAAFGLLVAKTVAYFLLMGGLPRNAGGRPNILFLYAGGNNIEVSWLGAFTCFLPTKYVIPSLGIVVVHSVLYQSRSGILVALLVLLFRAREFVPSGIRRLASRVVVATCTVFVGLAVLIFTWESTVKPALTSIQERFARIGDQGELGSSTRLEIWQAACGSIRNKPWGNGIGNTMQRVREVADRDFRENNVHNIYLQLAADIGIHSLVVYLVWAVGLIFWLRSRQVDHGLLCFVLTYWALATLQFTGYESFFWLIVGIGASASSAVPNAQAE